MCDCIPPIVVAVTVAQQGGGPTQRLDSAQCVVVVSPALVR